MRPGPRQRKGIRSSVNNVQSTLIRERCAHRPDRVSVPAVLALNGHHRADATDRRDRHLLPVLQAFGFTLNVMSLMALSLAIGILIDDAIVVRENIARHIALGRGHREASLHGTRRNRPGGAGYDPGDRGRVHTVAFMGGIIGRFFFQFGITVSAAVLISLFVSFTLDPMLSSVWHDPQSAPSPRARWACSPGSLIAPWLAFLASTSHSCAGACAAAGCW